MNKIVEEKAKNLKVRAREYGLPNDGVDFDSISEIDR